MLCQKMGMPHCVQLDLGYLPKISQTGLSGHGRKAKESVILPHLWALHVYRYSGKIEVFQHSHPFQEGCISLIPPNTEATWHFPPHAPHLYAHFFLRPSADKSSPLPVIQSLEQKFIPFCDYFEAMIQEFHNNPRHGAVRLWSLLLDCIHLSDDKPDPKDIHPILQMALASIRDLGIRSSRLCTIAQTIGVSQRHLNSLFKQEFGCTLHEYVHKNRTWLADCLK